MLKLAFAACTLIGGLSSAAAVAAPATVAGNFGDAQTISIKTAVHCWWDAGRRHCSGRSHGYHSRWYPHDARELRTGSRRWWDQKESEGSAGRP
jgi:hypothetical protein